MSRIYTNAPALTTAGTELKAKIELGDGALPLKLTRITLGAGVSGDPLNLTAVVDERDELTVTDRTTTGPRTTLTVFVLNTGVREGYPITQIGFYAEDPEKGEILYRIFQPEMPHYMPSEDERAFRYVNRFNFITGNASEVTVMIDPSGLATMDWVADKLTQHDESPDAHENQFSKIPAVNNPAVVITQGGTERGRFNLNQPGGVTIDVERGIPIPDVSRTFNDNSWDAIAQVSEGYISLLRLSNAQISADLGWNIGDRKTVNIAGHNYDLRIIGFNHDNRVGGGKAGITLELGVQTGGTQAISFGTTTDDRRVINPASNQGGWEGCEMRSFLNSTGEFASAGMLQLLPGDLRTAIKTVINPTGTDGRNPTLIHSHDKLFLMSHVELFGTNMLAHTVASAPGEGVRYAWYTANDILAARVKQQPFGTAASWWLRSPHYGSNAYHVWRFISNTGHSSSTSITGQAHGIPFVLCV